MASSTSGGAAGAGGFAYQHAVTAWAAIRILSGHAAPPAWELPADTIFDWLRCETEQPVDDLLLGTSRSGLVFCNVKRSVNLGASDSSDFASVIVQFVRQFLNWRGRPPGERAWERALEPSTDRLVLICTSSASGAIRLDLANSLSRLRGLLPGQALEEAAQNDSERAALKTVVDRATAAWTATLGTRPSETDLASLLRLVHVQALDLERGEAGTLEAEALLRSSVLRHPESSELAWGHLQTLSATLARTRSGADRPRLQRSLEDAGLDLHATPSYRADIERLRQYSFRTLERLRQLSQLQQRQTNVKIRRASTAALVDAVEIDSFVVVGQPGAGKSGGMHDLAERLVSVGRDVVVLAVDHLEASSLGGLRQELGLEHEITDVLANWPGRQNGVLVLDALDAARGEPASQTTRDLIATVLDKLPRWRVVASIRKFDLRHSVNTQRIFRGTPPTAFTDSEFFDVRHVDIPVLSSDELAQLQASDSRLYDVLQAVPLEIRSVLFNVRLMADLLDSGVDQASLRPIQNQLELFEKYWQHRVTKEDGHEDDREQVLRNACERMVATRTLHVDRSAIVAPGAGPFLNALLSEQVLAEWQPHPDSAPDRYVLTFSHHVLFDYAVARVLFRRLATAVSQQVGVDPDLVLIVRPSLVLHSHYCWSLDPNDRSRFWELVLEIGRNESVPEVGKLIGPSVAADLARVPSDIARLLDATENPVLRRPTSRVLQHLIGAVVIQKDQRSLAGRDAGPWSAVAERLSRSIDEHTAHSLRLLVTTLSDCFELHTPAQLAEVGLSSRRLLEFAWATAPRDSWLVVFAIQCVSRTFASDPGASFALLSRALEPAHVEQFGFDELSWLAREAKRLLVQSPEFVGRLYKAAFGHEESSTDTTALGSGRILTLTSTRRQDYAMALYALAELFPQFLERDVLRATSALMAAIQSYVLLRRRGAEAETKEFAFADSIARIRVDYSYIWDAGSAFRHDEPLRMLAAFVAHADKMAGTADGTAREAVVQVVIDENDFAVMWRRLLRVGARHPQRWGRLLVPLLSAQPVLMGVDTTHAAGDLLRAVFPLLDESTRAGIERTLLLLPAVRGDDHTHRNRLLGCLDPSDLVTPEARGLRAALEQADAVPENDEPVRFRSGASSFSEEDYLEEQGVPVHEESNKAIRALEAPVQRFVQQHRNSPPSVRQSAEMLGAFSALLRRVRSADVDGVHERQRDHALATLTEACGAVAAGDGLSREQPVAEFCHALLIEASENPDPIHNPESDPGFDSSPSWGAAIRIDAARGLIRLARHREFATPEVMQALTRLVRDSVPAVRYQISSYLNAVYETAHDWMWAEAETLASHEASTSVLNGLVGGPLDTLAGKHPDRVAVLVNRIFDRIPDGPGADSLREACATVLILLAVWRNTDSAVASVERIAGAPATYAAYIVHALHPLRGPLTYGQISPTNRESDEIRERALAFLLRVVRVAVDEFERIHARNAGASTHDWQLGDLETAKSLADVIDGICSTLYFSSGAFKAGDHEEERPTRAQEVRLFREGLPLFELLASVGLPRVAHHLIETFEHFVDVNPEQVFLLIGRTVQAGRRGGYQFDSLAADLMVKVVERYLAEYRYLFRQSTEARSALLAILDVFVTAGWPSARQLTYGLEEIFR